MGSTRPPEVLAFGPQSLSFDHQAATRLHSQLFGNPRLHWALDTLRNLHSSWSRLSSSIPILQHLDGEKLLRNITSWLQVGETEHLAWPLPNIILTPLTVVLQLVELEQRTKVGFQTPGNIDGYSEVLGLCTGLLIASAIACSSDEAQLGSHGAVAIRLAMLIGAVVDAKDMSLTEPERAASFSVHWTQKGGTKTLDQVLETIPEAYISVVQDEQKATVTTSETTAERLLERLQQYGFVAVKIPLRGYFHWKGHLDSLGAAMAFCDSNPEFCLKGSSGLIRSNETGLYMGTVGLHHTIIRSMLVEQSNWHKVFEKLQDSTGRVHIESFGPERFVPTSMSQTIPSKMPPMGSSRANSHGVAHNSNASEAFDTERGTSRECVAVIGMACHLPGAADMGEFWTLLCSANSQHVEVPTERFDFATAWRQSDQRKWYGNFVEDYDVFDNRFFKKNAREAASTDPQQRLMLQVAYQAVEQSGYLSVDRDKNIGCYIAFGSGDYQENIACHPANAYSATGNLKAFAAGKISHYFGWTGPGFTIDSACSSSAVAIHLACQGILSNDCTAALVGGVNIISGPEWFYNLAGASFLSPTGQCKPFDTAADGYCRGEAVGAVVLKRLSSAIEDGDQIFGIIAGSAVQQNQNNTAITVPNEPSLSELFHRVSEKAGLAPMDVSYVEAHGTGTAVGDPAEYDSIRRVFGGPARSKENRLSVGSVKGLVGHAESASGMVALLKVLAMMHHGAIPPQASFQTINPALYAQHEDHMEICTAMRPWDARSRAALINNYGASGSNASFLVLPPPEPLSVPHPSPALVAAEGKLRYPFGFYASDETALQRYVSKLLKSIKSATSLNLPDISFQVSRQSNKALQCLFSFSCKSTTQLEKNLEAWTSTAVTVLPPPRPVILCFGGQNSTFVGLDKQVFDTANIFRAHLDRCNAVCEMLGTTIYPVVFQKTPIQDVVQLHAALFTVQYACGRTWLDCISGVEFGAVLGHSIGELSALCVSGAVSLEDMMGYIIGRARLIRDAWGSERGSMLVVEADLGEVTSLLAEAATICPDEHAASIACFNGRTSFTLAGSTKAINTVFRAAATSDLSSKIKKLDVTNAYHCSLTDAILPEIRKLAQNVKFREPSIHIEHATEEDSEGLLDSNLLANHFRQPVFFSHAIQRLAKRLPSAIWIEAGSNSGVTMMASRALKGILPFASSTSHFQPLNITTGAPAQGLADATVALWREGINVSFWPHHHSQTREYRRIILPPYQFEKTRHWVERKTPEHAATAPSQTGVASDSLWSFILYQDSQKRSARFRINTCSEEFQSALKAHVVAQGHPLCPSILQLDIVIDALMSLRPSFRDGTCQPQLLGMDTHAPMFLEPSRKSRLDVHATDPEASIWAWTISSAETDGKTESKTTTHATGRISFFPTSSSEAVSEFNKFERLVRRKRCLDLLNGGEVDDVIQGQRNIYRIFADVIEYGKMFQGLQKLVGKDGQESAGRVVRTRPKHSWLDFTMADCFCQIAGIFINSMTDRLPDEMYISDRIGQYTRSPRLQKGRQRPDTFEVYACHDRPSSKEFLSDVFVFDPNDGALIEVILGIHYRRISKTALSRVLMASGATGLGSTLTLTKSSGTPQVEAVNTGHVSATEAGFSSHQEIGWVKPIQHQRPSDIPTQRVDIASRLKDIIASLSGLDTAEIADDSQFVDLGIDSLMGMELSREIENAFNCTAHATLVMDLTDFRSLVSWVEEASGVRKRETTPSTKIARLAPKVSGSDPRATQKCDSTSKNGLSRLLENSVQDRTAGIIRQAFMDSKQATDRYIIENGLAGYVDNVLPRSDELCITMICDAFEQLGCPIQSAAPGQKLAKVDYLPRHENFVSLLYDLLESRAGLIERNELGEITRTAAQPSSTPAQSILQELNHQAPAHIPDHNLTYLTGMRLADCLVGKADCTQIIFGSPEARKTVSAMYSQSPINAVWIKQMEDFIKSVVPRLPRTEGSIRILELGAGTGGTTSKLVPILANLQLEVPCTYTVTDISSSMVAAAKQRFKHHSFVDCRVLDIEKGVKSEYLHSYDIVLATNCVHATHSLANTTKNLRDMLRPHGFLLMLEMTESLAWVELVFGLLEGWWLFDDGRKHALASPTLWEKTLHDAGFGRVEWTTGELPESGLQRLILAMVTGWNHDIDGPSSSVSLHCPSSGESDSPVNQARKKAVSHYVQQYTADFSLIPNEALHLNGLENGFVDTRLPVVLVTGATGSLGSHLLQYLSTLPEVGMIICLNRTSSAEAQSRQENALRSKDMSVDRRLISRWRVFQTDTHRRFLGLSPKDYHFLAQNVTHVIHNAWPMSIRRPIKDYEMQFKAMRNLIDLARDAHTCQRTRIAFQFISSIAVVGLHPLRSGQEYVPEEPVSVESVLPNGYGEAKLVCEMMLAETLQRFPEAFGPAMTVRIGQIAGSRLSGYWNPVEHFAFMMASSQTLGYLPDLRGSLSWCPVDEVASALGELLLSPEQQHRIYHIENPVRQDWKPMIEWLAAALEVKHVVPYTEWLARVCGESSITTEQAAANPAARLSDFLQHHFVRMSCGGLVLSTEKSRAGSKVLRHVGPVDEDLVKRYVRCWKQTGLLRI